ncbi:GNAT family N-acetyltransferase [Cohnella yongneupensis]|uniref:GNAT family N-acetyltransferase n=1 Tax=Cohnella yongneupensis TaxID=425006 RepID=A0ABW0QVL7_9BACL
MKIREARQDELAHVREQRIKAYLPYARLIPEGHWKALEGSLASEADQQSGARLFVAESGGEPVGSVVLFPAKSDAYDGHIEAVDYPEIRMLAVHEDYRGKGVASALVTECIARARAEGHRYIGLHTGEFMEPAIRLYERIGFERVPENDFQPAGDGVNVRAYRLPI